jgi:hypothetical protein
MRCAVTNRSGGAVVSSGVRSLVAFCAFALLVTGCSGSKATHVAISADRPPKPSTWGAYPRFSQHSCWSRAGIAKTATGAAPSLPASQTAHPTSPAKLVRRLLGRFGDRSFVRRIEIGAPPPRRVIKGFLAGKEPPRDALWAYLSAPKAAQVASAHITPGEARERELAYWETELIGGALRDDFCRAGGPPLIGWSVEGVVNGAASGSSALNQRFPNPSAHDFRARVALVGKRYGFHALSIRFLRPRELAPIVVVETNRDRKKFVADVAAMVDLLDPRSSSGHQSAITFEGFFFEARDAKGPFVRVDNVYRGDVMGGQWSSDRDSYPYPHG